MRCRHSPGCKDARQHRSIPHDGYTDGLLLDLVTLVIARTGAHSITAPLQSHSNRTNRIQAAPARRWSCRHCRVQPGAEYNRLAVLQYSRLALRNATVGQQPQQQQNSNNHYDVGNPRAARATHARGVHHRGTCMFGLTICGWVGLGVPVPPRHVRVKLAARDGAPLLSLQTCQHNPAVFANVSPAH